MFRVEHTDGHVDVCLGCHESELQDPRHSRQAAPLAGNKVRTNFILYSFFFVKGWLPR